MIACPLGGETGHRRWFAASDSRGYGTNRIRKWSRSLIEKPAMACMRMVRDLEGYASLKVNVEFDENADAELKLPKRQDAVKKMLENAVLNVCMEELTRNI